MPTFVIEQFESWTSKVEVEATSYVEAIKKWRDGKNECVSVSEFVGIDDTKGISLYRAFNENQPTEKLGFDTTEDLSMITENIPGFGGIYVKKRHNGRKKS